MHAFYCASPNDYADHPYGKSLLSIWLLETSVFLSSNTVLKSLLLRTHIIISGKWSFADRVLLTEVTEYFYRYTITNVVLIYRTLILKFDTLFIVLRTMIIARKW